MDKMPDAFLKTLQRIKHSPLRNYIIPGLTSWMLRNSEQLGCLRFFEMEREQHMGISPHSHRFDFDCYVVEGSIKNTLWIESGFSQYDEMVITDLIYDGKPGAYRHEIQRHGYFRTVATTYGVGEWYGMTKDQIHSIQFAKGSKVLFFEGPQLSDRSILLEPFSAGHHVKQAETLPWMFKSDVVVDDHFT